MTVNKIIELCMRERDYTYFWAADYQILVQIIRARAWKPVNFVWNRNQNRKGF